MNANHDSAGTLVLPPLSPPATTPRAIMDLHEGPGNSLEGAFGYSTESLSRNSDVLEVIAPRLRRRSDRPSNVDAGRPTFSPDDRVSFDLHSHAVPAGSTPERAPRLSPSPSKISDPGLVIHAPIELAASAPSLRFQQLQVEDRPEPSARERVIQLRKGWVHFAAVCFAVFVTGWNDGSTGPLLPRIQAFYGVGQYGVIMLGDTACDDLGQALLSSRSYLW
jgi:hypothetical protein